ncbi:MAG: helix-turn-helix domain-containing protein [Flavobacteriaceae bacterium]
MENRVYTAEMASEVLSCHVRTLRKKLTKKELKGHKRLNKWYVLHSDIIKFLKGSKRKVTIESIYNSVEASKILNCNVRTLRDKLVKKELKGYKKLTNWYVLHSDIVNYIENA